MDKRFLSVGQKMQRESFCGAIYLIGGLIFSCKTVEKNWVLVAGFAIFMILNSIFSIYQSKVCEEEKFDEMATDNLNKASRRVLLDLDVVFLIVLIVDIIQDTLKLSFSLVIPWEKYFSVNPFSLILLIMGFQYLMTSIHFKKLESE